MDQITQGLPGPASPAPIPPVPTSFSPQGNPAAGDKSKKLKIWGSVLGIVILAIVGFSVFYGKSILYPGKIPPPGGAGGGQIDPASMCPILNTEARCAAVSACQWNTVASKCAARQGGGGGADAGIQVAQARAAAAVQAAQTAAAAAQAAANQIQNNEAARTAAANAQTALNDAKAAFNIAKRAVTTAEAEQAATEAEAARNRAVAAQHDAEAALAAQQEADRQANAQREQAQRDAAMEMATTAAHAARVAANKAQTDAAQANTDAARAAAAAADQAADAAEAAVVTATETGTLDAANTALRTAQRAKQDAETAQADAATELQRVRNNGGGGNGGGGGRNASALRNACTAFQNIGAEFIAPEGEDVALCKIAGQTYNTVDTLRPAASKECGTRQWTWNPQNSTCTNPADDPVGEFLRTCSEIGGTSDAENRTCTYNGRTFQHNELAALREEKQKIDALALLKQICTDPAVMGDTACTLDGISFTEPDSLADYQTRKKECASKDQNDWEWVPGDKQCKNKRAQREQEEARQHEEEIARHHAREEGEARGRAEAEANRQRDEIARLQNQLAQATSTNNDARIAELSQRIADLTTQMSQRSAAAPPAPAPAPAPAPSIVAVVAPSPAAAPSTPAPTSPATAPAAASSSSSSASERVVAVVTPKEAKEAQKNKPKTGEGKTSAAESAAGASTASNNVASNTAGSATSGSAAASAATRAATQRLHGAFIQGKTGPEVMLYPVLIAGANGLYYFLRKRRKNKK